MLGAWRKSKFTHIIRALLFISQIKCDDSVTYVTVTIVKINTAMRQTLQLNVGIRQIRQIHKAHIDKAI